MSSPAVFKVFHAGHTRRIALPAAAALSWAEVAQHLHQRFSLHPASSVALSYTDEDGDTVILSSDVELQEVVAGNATGRVLRFTLVVDGAIIDADNSAWTVPAGSEGWSTRASSVVQGPSAAVHPYSVPSEPQRQPPPVREELMADASRVTVEEVPDKEFSPYGIPDGGGESSRPISSAATAATDKGKQPATNNTDAPANPTAPNLGAHIEKVVSTLQDIYSQHPELRDSIQGLADAVRESLELDIALVASFLGTPSTGDTTEPSAAANEKTPEGSGCHRGAWRSSSQCRGRGGPSPHFMFAGGLPPWHHPFGMGGPMHHHGPRHGCHQHPHHQHPHPHHQHAHHGPGNANTAAPEANIPVELSERDIDHQLAFLADMGFVDVERNRELLQRYGGNTGRVVEVLARETGNGYGHGGKFGGYQAGQ